MHRALDYLVAASREKAVKLFGLGIDLLKMSKRLYDDAEDALCLRS